MSKTDKSIMSIREMIEIAFGQPDVNTVDHKLIQTILFLLARQLRVLERQVTVEMGLGMELSSSSLSVTEVKMHAMQKKKKTIKDNDRGKDGGKDGAKGTKLGRVGAASKRTAPATPKKTDIISSDPSSKGDKSSSDKQSSATKSSNKQLSATKSSDKHSNATTSSDKQSSATTSSDKQSTATKPSDQSKDNAAFRAANSSQEYYKFLETLEEQRETELRVIRQRADSREEHEKTPTPMVSLDSVEAQYEKLLVVERVPSEEAKAIASRGRNATPKLSVVTLEQFATLAATVRELQARFDPIATPSFPENAQLMQDLRKGASLTDAMAALQLSARLEAAEKALEQMLSLVTELASKTPGIDITAPTAEVDMQVIFGAPGATSRKTAAIQPPPRSPTPPPTSSEESIEISLPPSALQTEEFFEPREEETGQKPDCVTFVELDNAMQELYDELMKAVTTITTRSTANADNAFKIASRLDGRLEASLNLGTRMDDLETSVSNYSEQINILDTNLSSQMTDYQEQLTQMQHDLETGLENMAEALANTGGDTAAVAELNTQFTNLQLDIDNTALRQKELRVIQNTLAFDLEALLKQVELLRETKSDREEVADALRDKAGLGALNGLVSLQQFDAVCGDFEKRIGAAYDKFNNQEIVWQKAIDDLLRELNEKSDWIQVVSLRDDINKNLEMLRSRIHTMMEIVGEPRAAAVKKKLQRDVACLSCASPACIDSEEPGTVPKLPAFHGTRPSTIGAEAPTPKDDGDHGICYPGYPITHPRDPRSHECNRYCGGSHTVLPSTLSRAPAGMIVTPVLRNISTAIGSDGKMYMIDEPQTETLCLPCNVPKILTPQPSETDHVLEKGDIDSDMLPPDFAATDIIMAPALDNISMTPPPPVEED